MISKKNLLSRTVAILCVFCWRLLCHWLRTTQPTPPKLNSRAVSRGFCRANCPALERGGEVVRFSKTLIITKNISCHYCKVNALKGIRRVQGETEDEWEERYEVLIYLNNSFIQHKLFSYILCVSRIDWRRMPALFCSCSKSRAIWQSEEKTALSGNRINEASNQRLFTDGRTKTHQAPHRHEVLWCLLM